MKSLLQALGQPGAALVPVVAAMVLLLASVAAQAERRVALVIGNGAYRHSTPLPNPANDARAMAGMLEGLGFEVANRATGMVDLDLAGMKGALAAFGRSARGADIAVVFYAGHGLEVDGQNWLLPVDARLSDEFGLQLEAMPLETVLAFANAARVRVVLLDACRDNPLAEQMVMLDAGRSAGRGLARVETTVVGTLLGYATSPRTVASDGDGENSPYTTALLDHLPTPDLSLPDAMIRVTAAVQEATGGRQTPWVNSSLNADVRLSAAPAAAVEDAAVPAEGSDVPEPVAREQLAARAYEAAERLATVAAYEAFLRRFPESFYAELARGHLRELTETDGSAQAETATTKPASADPAPEAAETDVAALAVEEPADAPSSTTPEEGEGALGLDRSARRLVQESLTALGFSTRGVDGVIGPRSRDAIARWQAARGDEDTGYLTGAQHGGLIAEASEAVAAARAEARARFAPGRKFRDCASCPEMVVIPGGTFTQGSPASEEGRYSDEGPQRRVSVRPFALGVTEVTFAQWDACVSSGGCSHRPVDAGWGRGSRPVINVSWNDAKAYIAWLNRKVEGRPYRLPSESEWEYAARAGTQTRYSWGDGVGRNRANCDGCGSRWDGESTAPVGSFSPNRFGLHDMHGNVREWVEDCWNGSYSGAPRNGSAWRSGDCSRAVLRGGSWSNRPDFLRTADRTGARATSGAASSVFAWHGRFPIDDREACTFPLYHPFLRAGRRERSACMGRGEIAGPAKPGRNFSWGSSPLTDKFAKCRASRGSRQAMSCVLDSPRNEPSLAF